MEEMIDVVDDDGNLTGEVLTRSEVHRQGKWHKVMILSIVTNDGKVLLQKRSMAKKKQPGLWDISAAGHISAGQTSKEATIRELDEEVGLLATEDELIYIRTYKDIEKINEDCIDKQFYDCYLLKREYINLNDIKMQEEEVEEVKLVGLEEFKKMLNDKTLIDRYEYYNEVIKYLK